jgi:hypothetical protein
MPPLDAIKISALTFVLAGRAGDKPAPVVPSCKTSDEDTAKAI